MLILTVKHTLHTGYFRHFLC